MLESLGVNLTCFAGERKHRELKRITRNNCPGDAGQSHMVRKSMMKFTHDLIGATAFEPTFLIAQSASPEHIPVMRAMFRELGPVIYQAKSVHSTVGILKVGDCVHGISAGQVFVGLAELFLSGAHNTSGEKHLVIRLQAAEQLEGRPMRFTGTSVFYPLECAKGAVPYVLTSGGFLPLLPMLEAM